jgi:chitosanase
LKVNEQMSFSSVDKLKALAIVRVFETSEPLGDYSAVAVLDDGAGVSYGISQFTHRSGSLVAVVERYLGNGGAVGRAVIEDTLYYLKRSDGAAIAAVAGDERFKKALRAAGITREMREAQERVAFERYLKPAIEACEGSGFVLPLSLAVVYDSMTHGSWEKIRVRVTHSGVKCVGPASSADIAAEPGEGTSREPAALITPKGVTLAGTPKGVTLADEKAWITEYVRKRHAWLRSVPRLASTSYRTKFFLDQIATGRWNLELPLNVHGVKLTDEMFRRTAMTTTHDVENLPAPPTTPTSQSLGSPSSGRRGVGEEIEPAIPASHGDEPTNDPPHNLPGPSHEDGRREAVPADEGQAQSNREREKVQKGKSEKVEEKSVMESFENGVMSAAERYDRVERVVSAVVTRKDSAKSLWTTVVGTVWQSTWAVIGFLSGMPREVWLVAAVIAGVLMLLYLYRQVELGRIRENREVTSSKFRVPS